MSDKQTFNWGDTPCIIVGRVDHFLAVPCWYDSVGKDDARTHRLKKYHAHDALFRGSWLDQNISSCIGHLTLTKGSELWIIDGYPEVFLGYIMSRFNVMYERLFNKAPGKPFTNKIKVSREYPEQHFLNKLTEAEALAKETGRKVFILGKQSFTQHLPEMEQYHESLKAHQQLQQQQLRDAYSTYNEPMTAEPMTQEEIDELLKKPNDDPDDGGTIQ